MVSEYRNRYTYCVADDMVTCSLSEATYQLPPFFFFVSFPALRSLNLEAELYKL